MDWFTRRELLGGAALAGGALLIGAEARAAILGKYPFSLGVASGDPAPDGMVLWTRLAIDPMAPDGGMPPRAVPVRWEISENEHFAGARSGTALAEPLWGHSVHVEVTGLKPGRPYWYRFIMGGETSPVGRTRTAPAHGLMADRLRLCFSSCQKYEAGYYAAWRHMVAEDPDLIVFLGDYIYEGDPSNAGVRKHKNPKPADLGGYRVRYASYKLDPLLQAAHHAAPWISTWDDHEVENNYTGDLGEKNGDPAAFLKLRAAAYHAYYEHMPLRRSARPAGASASLYRTIDWGGLAQFQVIDDRQYRTSPPCQMPGAVANHIPTVSLEPDCAERDDPARSMLGGRQEAWLANRLDKTRARWNLLSQQTLMMPFERTDPDHKDRGPNVYDTDEWEGFPATRDRIVRRWRDAKTPNPIVLSGDIHSFAAGDFSDPDDAKRLIASEFVGGSITSLNHSDTFKPDAARDPHFHYAENEVRGYGRVDLTPGRCDVVFRGLADALDQNSTIRDLARFTVENGRPGIQSG
ncbi:MAG: alkaline phosphatase [Sphingomonas bacterium]|uniref:alkaline phosphatase D family protein n=1 Tax=Sphingomonas bacterium TaxID=1895847 RepID=UPI002606C807|nr:alkaline phosphatase D family protein [Sphingomonas bacterium]MDB5705989.1 alkaline phosphatase [Sphingomonas bacterium]